MRALCFDGYYTQRFAGCREFLHGYVEDKMDRDFEEYCNKMLQEEFALQSGAEKYERTEDRVDRRNGHYRRRLVTARGVVNLRVPRGERGKYTFTLFEKNHRKTRKFEMIVREALLKGFSSRKAGEFFAKLFGVGTISHQAAVSTLRKFDLQMDRWRQEPIADGVVIMVVDAVHLKGVIPHLKSAKPVLFAYGVYPDGTEKVLDFELAAGESLNAYYRFCLNLKEGLAEGAGSAVHISYYEEFQ